MLIHQVVNVHLCRSRRRSIVSRPLFENSLISAGIVAEIALILLIDYTAPGNATFGTSSIGYEAWLIVLPFAAAMLAFEEARKALVRWREAANTALPIAANVKKTTAGPRRRTSRSGSM